MTLPCPFHTTYRFSAVAHSIAAIIEFYVWIMLTEKKDLDAKYALWVYFIFRMALGVPQLVIHLFMLIPAQYSTIMARWVLRTLFANNVEVFYEMIYVCNIALVPTIIANILALALLLAVEVPSLLWILELFSINVLFYVGGLRLMARNHNLVRSWFYLKW